ncbi:Vacuolar protein sorting-associated protein 30 [Podosphaera aphanis]|nr:Vacuolar protein sorting-associated protein 30 [Podosphaera aphanis]
MYCQKCRTPLRLDGSLEDLNPAAFDLLVGASTNPQIKSLPPSRLPYPPERKQLYDKLHQKNASSIFGRFGPKDDTLDTFKNAQGNPAMSFVMLTESQVASSSESKSKEIKDADLSERKHGETTAMSQDMEKMSRLFSILTARSDIDFPVCVECTDLLVTGLQKRLDSVTKERDAYFGFLKQMNAEIPTDEEILESQQALNKVKLDEEAAMQELKRLEGEKATLDDQIAIFEDESRALDMEEDKFWYERNEFAMKLAEFQNVRDSVNLQYDHDSQVLDKLQRTNVYNDTFCISHDGNFGTINGLRLGRLSNIPVDWPEINAAWGHTVLLLQTVADRLGFTFEGYQLQPMGSTSRILRYENISSSNSLSQHAFSAKTTKKAVLGLYSSGDMPLGLTFMHRHLDTAMVAFLECVRQLGTFVEAGTTRSSGARVALKLPYKIEGDKIGGVSIKLGIAQDDAWSRACKFTLTCCKFLLAHASNVNTAANYRRTP